MQPDSIKNEIRRQLRCRHGQDIFSINCFFELWSELVNSMIAWGYTASQIIADIHSIEDACDCLGWPDPEI